MKIRTAKVCLAAIFVIVLLVPSINADWAEGGIKLSTEPSDQYNQQIISDGSDGAIVVWQDDRNGMSDMDVFAQRFDCDGNILWDAAGVNISELGLNQTDPVLVTDGAGGAIIVYKSDRADAGDIIAQRIRSNGTLAWTAGGLTVCGFSNNQNSPRIVSNDTGGAIVTWTDHRSVTSADVYAARIDSSGATPWTYNGVPVCQAAGDQYSQEIVPDGSSGAIITWADYRAGNSDIYAQKLHFNGNYAWTNNGNPVTTQAGAQYSPVITSDMNGGAIVVWLDFSSVDTDIVAERLLSDGTRIWNPGTGIYLCNYVTDQYSPLITSDGAGGAIVAWMDNRNGISDIYAQHIDYAGGIDWIEDGAAICTDPSTQYQHDLVSDGYGGAIIFWTDTRLQNNYEIFGQRIGADGMVKWQYYGLNLTDYPAYQSEGKAIATGDGGIIVCWKDSRDLFNNMIYAQVFDRYGCWGDPAPVITDVSDVPGDQGGSVQITWSPARMDAYPDETVTHYTVWRSVSGLAAESLLLEGSMETPPGSVGLDFEGTAYRFDIVAGAAAAWEWVASVEAHYWEEYAYTCGTLQDSTAGDEGMLHFVISANTADQFTFWDSAPDSGYSVDNLAPCPPLALAGEQSYEPEGLELTWAPNTEADLGGYNIYRGTDPTFDPDPSCLLASTCDAMTFDGDWTWDSGYCYKVAAVDIHGNESEYAVLCFEQVTGDDPMPLPDATFLAQNFPNPFNPITNIGFGIKEQAYVSLRIYDAAGRLIAILIDGSRPAGTYAAEWNGKAQNGSPSASGIYFYRLTTRTFSETKKMILLR